MFLLADNSNRTTKLAIGDVHSVHPNSLRRIDSNALSLESLGAAFGDLPFSPMALVWSSVTHDGPHILRAFAEHLGIPSLELTWQTAPLDFADYENPATIGPDRLANALAAASRFSGEPVIAIDAGTAITFNIVTPGSPLPRFLGGAIAPGVRAFTTWLSENTARLPEITFPANDVPAIGSGTLPALQSAARHGLTGMIKEILNAQHTALGGYAKTIFTGTDAAILASLLDPKPLIDPLLTLEGLRLTGFHHFPEFTS